MTETGKIFCLAMQRTGTSSFGDFCQYVLGLERRGWQDSRKNQWGLKWYNGDFEGIFTSKDFMAGKVFEDTPWSFPDFYKVLYHRFPGSRFVHIERDADDWFRSMISHSGGKTLGITEIHAKAYRREADFWWLVENFSDIGQFENQGMFLFDQAEHYKRVYRLHNRETRMFFARTAPDRFLSLNLSDPEKWRKAAVFLGFEDKPYQDVHTNKSR